MTHHHVRIHDPVWSRSVLVQESEDAFAESIGLIKRKSPKMTQTMRAEMMRRVALYGERSQIVEKMAKAKGQITSKDVRAKIGCSMTDALILLCAVSEDGVLVRHVPADSRKPHVFTLPGTVPAVQRATWGERILQELRSAGEGLGIGELAKRFKVNVSHLSHPLLKLMAKGLVKRTAPATGWAVYELTVKGGRRAA